MKPDHSVGADHRLEHVDKGDTPRVPEDAFAALGIQSFMRETSQEEEIL